MEHLQAGVGQLVVAGLSLNTRQAYASALANFRAFQNNYSLSLQWPVPETQIHLYITYLFQSGYAPSTAALHISAISFEHKIRSITDTTSTYSVSKMLEGFKRIRSNPDTRMPVMYDNLISICKILGRICTSSYEVTLFRAAYTLAFFGLFRVSEIVLTSPFQTDQPLHETDLKFQTKATGEFLQICLRKSKSSQKRKTYIDIPMIGSDPECPVLAMKAYIKLRPNNSIYLFCHKNGKPLTRYQFGSVLSKAIQAIQLPTARFKTHSFRIGACSWLASRGVSHQTIKQMGRWQSDSFLKYIRL